MHPAASYTLFAVVMIGMLTRSYSFLSAAKRAAVPRAQTFRRMSDGNGVKVMSVGEFGNIINDEDLRANYQIIDVREPMELEAAKIDKEDIINLPLQSAGEWGGKIANGELLDPAKPTLVLCKLGIRSMKVATFLTSQAGFEEVYNVAGGIAQYAAEVDPKIPQY